MADIIYTITLQDIGIKAFTMPMGFWPDVEIHCWGAGGGSGRGGAKGGGGGYAKTTANIYEGDEVSLQIGQPGTNGSYPTGGKGGVDNSYRLFRGGNSSDAYDEDADAGAGGGGGGASWVAVNDAYVCVANGGTGTTTAFTAGSVVFAGASGVYSQSNANFFWDNTNARLGIGTATPGAPLSFGTTIGSAGTPNKIRLYESGTNLYGLNVSTGQLEIIAGTSGSIVSYTNGAERMRIDSSGIVTGTAGNLMLVSSTALATTSGTSKDFTSIPSWVKRITVMFNAVSLSGTANLLIQIGTGGTPTTSGYSSTSSYALASGSASGGVSSTAGYIMYISTASYIFSGHIVLTNVSGNIWVSSGLISNVTTTPYTGQ